MGLGMERGRWSIENNCYPLFLISVYKQKKMSGQFGYHHRAPSVSSLTSVQLSILYDGDMGLGNSNEEIRGIWK